METSYITDTLPIGDIENEIINNLSSENDTNLFLDSVIDLRNIKKLSLDDFILELPKTIIYDNNLCELRISYHNGLWQCYYIDADNREYFISKDESIYESIKELYDNVLKIYEND